ncbi:MAG: SO_0444 family Cu/Zn efflux transporter [Thermoguttaceae bacterium]|jgi:uncharacterized membrane protein YraQ (UPF0718 family)/copper chaperone CopZ
MIAILEEFAYESWLVLGQMAPYLLFGFLVAGILSVCFSPQWIERHLGRPGFGPVVKASLLGVPLPLCSCGVIPVAASIRRHGASRAATTSFLLSTPQTGVDSIAITYALLGPVFAVFRPIAALITGLVGGGLVQLFGEQDGEEHSTGEKNHSCTELCCADKESRNIVWRSLHYGFVTLPRDIGAALLIGVLVAGAITVIAPANDELKPYLGGGIGSILIMMAIGVPIYVCAAASIPIAAGLIHLGASPGAALAFLISGPATNAATITTTWKLMGRRTSLLYLLTIAVSAIGCALLLDWIFSFVPFALPQINSHVHQHMHESGWISAFWAIVLLAVIGFSYLQSPKKEAGLTLDEDSTSGGSSSDQPTVSSERLDFTISGMTCGHCVETVGRTLRQSPGVRRVEVNLKEGRAVVTGEHLDPQQLTAAVNSLGYEMKLQ